MLSDAVYRALVDFAPDAMVVVDEDGLIVFANAQMETTFGYDPGELVGQPIEVVVPDRSRDVHRAHRAGFVADPRARSMGAGLLLTGRRKDGTEFPVEISLSPVRGEEGILIAAAVRDVSDRVAAEEQFRALLESAPDAMVVVADDGSIVLVNAQAEAMFGYARDDLLGAQVDVLVPQALRDTHVAHRRAFMGDPHARPMGAGLRLFARRADGTEFPVEISLSPLRRGDRTLVSAAIRDITDRVHADEQAALMHHTTRALGEAPDYQTGLHTVLGIICEMTGWPFGQAWRPAGSHFDVAAVWHDPADARGGDFHRASVELALEVGGGIVGEVYRVGKPMWITDVAADATLVRARPARDAGFVSVVFIPVLAAGVPVAVLEFFIRERTPQDERLLGVVSGIATQLGALFERKQAVDALRSALEREREAAERLRSLDRMKDTFLHAVSHELRSPLAVVVGFADTLVEHRASIPEDQVEHMIASIATHATRLNKLLTDLLDLDRLARGVLEPKRADTDIALLARTSAKELQLGDRDVNVAGEGIVAWVDPSKVERILENLLSNAARYSPADAPIDVRVSREDDAVLVEVGDRGKGVPDELKEHIFNVFDRGTAPANIPGTGIGLSLVSRFAELHGGRAWVEDRPGGGALFKVLLPDASGRASP